MFGDIIDIRKHIDRIPSLSQLRSGRSKAHSFRIIYWVNLAGWSRRGNFRSHRVALFHLCTWASEILLSQEPNRIRAIAVASRIVQSLHIVLIEISISRLALNAHAEDVQCNLAPFESRINYTLEDTLSPTTEATLEPNALPRRKVHSFSLPV